MSMQSESKDAKGRNYDQVTKGGSSSAGTYGTGGTGDVGSMGAGEGGNAQRATRTDDLLSPAPDEEVGQDGYLPAEEAGELQTGLGGIGSLATGNAGNRQSEGDTRPGGNQDAMRSGSDSGASGVPASGGQGMQK